MRPFFDKVVPGSLLHVHRRRVAGTGGNGHRRTCRQVVKTTDNVLEAKTLRKGSSDCDDFEILNHRTGFTSVQVQSQIVDFGRLTPAASHEGKDDITPVLEANIS